MIDIELELDDALGRLTDAQDTIDRLREERDQARRMAVACENDERKWEREAAELRDAAEALLRARAGCPRCSGGIPAQRAAG